MVGPAGSGLMRVLPPADSGHAPPSSFHAAFMLAQRKGGAPTSLIAAFMALPSQAGLQLAAPPARPPRGGARAATRQGSPAWGAAQLIRLSGPVAKSRACRAAVSSAGRTMEASSAVITVPPPPHPTYDICSIVRQALEEDLGDLGDVTSLATIPEDTQAEAQFLAKADGVLAGVAVADLVFREVDPTLEVRWDRKDGDWITKGTIIGSVKGKAQSILSAERVSLNFMQRMSGIATVTKAMAEAAKPARLLETRKTVPGLRLLDKWAVLIGGGENHRMGLYDMLMIKDNHIAAAGGITRALEAASTYMQSKGLDLGVEVEARTLDEVREALECQREGRGKVTRLMLDNMVSVQPDGSIDVSLLKEAVELVAGEVETEASGNVTNETVNAIGATGVTFISSGALTHSVKALDISLNIDTDLAIHVGKRTNRA